MTKIPSIEKILCEDPWLSTVLERSVFKLGADPSQWGALGRELQSMRKEHGLRPFFVYAKVPAEHLDGVRILSAEKFQLVDTQVTFEKPLNPKIEHGRTCHLRLATPEDENQIVRLASRTFKHSRFHRDPEIGKDTADRLKTEWVRSYFRKARGDQMVIGEEKGEIVGFLQLLRGQDSALIIDLIAVAPDVQGRGIGGDMIAYAEAHFPELQRVCVGTQLVNTASICLYEKLGFQLIQSHYIFHYHHPFEYRL